MKKIILIFTLLMTFVGASAQTSTLPLFQAFDGRYNDKKGVTIYEVKQPGNYYYSIDVKDNPDIIRQLEIWTEETEKLSNGMNKTISEGNIWEVFFIPENKINVGVRFPTDKSKYNVYLQSSEPFM